MPQLTPANRLYFYRLLSEALGCGVQVTLARAEEVLDADGLAPRDVGCETWRELFDALGECVRVTVFKRGRTYVTVIANETYDGLLEKAAKGAVKGAEKGKSFKKKRGGKDLKPERPRPVPAPVVAPEPEPEPEVEVEIELVPEPEPEPELEVVPKPEPELELEPEPEPEPESEPEPEPEPAPAPEPSISLNITFDPRTEEEKNPAPILEPDPAPPLGLADVPLSITRDVVVNDEALAALSGVFPLGSDVLAVLDEDLAQARSTHSVCGARAVVGFPTRFELPSGKRLVVSLRRHAPNRAGKRWSLKVPPDLPETGVDGLPDAGLWPWTKLPSARSGVRPYVELARSVETGSWDDLLAQLRSLVPDSGLTGKELAAIVASAFMDKALTISADGQDAAFALPIATDTGAPVAVLLETQEGEVPWRLAGLEAADTLAEPLCGVKPVSHINALGEALVPADAVLDSSDKTAQRAFSRAQIEPKLARPAYDPLSGTALLLLPLDGQVLAIAPVDGKRYRVVAALDAEEANAL